MYQSLVSFPGYKAGGNIKPSRILTVTAGTPKQVTQATGSTAQPFIGISGKNLRYPPNSAADDGYHAISGEDVTIHSSGQICSLKLGSTAVTDLTIPLTSDTDGAGVPQAPVAATTCYYVAIPLDLGGANETITVFVLPPFVITN